MAVHVTVTRDEYSEYTVKIDPAESFKICLDNNLLISDGEGDQIAAFRDGSWNRAIVVKDDAAETTGTVEAEVVGEHTGE